MHLKILYLDFVQLHTLVCQVRKHVLVLLRARKLLAYKGHATSVRQIQSSHVSG